MKRTLKILCLALFLSGLPGLVFPILGAEHEHNYVVWLVEEPSCTEKGAAVFKCESCGETYTEYKAALGHDFKNYWDIDVEPTCGKRGEKSRHCKRCEAVTDVIPLKALDHSFKVTVIEPTCVLSGYDLYLCTVCGLETKNNIKNAAGHQPSLWIIDREPTCEDDGLRHRVCMICGITLEKVPISANKHSFKVTTVEPTCTEKGYSVHTCMVCGYSYKNKETKALGHSFSESGRIIENPTCTLKGSQMLTCKICGVSQERPIAALGHDYSDNWTVDRIATCSSNGQKSHHCKRCDSRKDVTSIEKPDHIAVTDKAVQATCTKSGKTEGSHCLVCGAVIVKQTTVAALGHDYSIIKRISEPTCTDSGLDEFTCAHCGNKKNKTVLKLGHEYDGNWRTVKEPTCTANGKRSLYCLRCKGEKSETIPKLGHDYTLYMTTDKKPTCTAKGEKSRHCLRCSARTDITPIERENHTEVIDEAVAATCTQSGKTQGSHCSVCKKVLTAQSKISPAGHREVKTVTKATMKKNGKIVVKCKTCRKVISKQTVYKISKAVLSKTAYTYDAKSHKPIVTVRDSKGKTLKKSKDYLLKYSSGRKAVGSYVVTVTFKGNYSGTENLRFSVVPKAPTELDCIQTVNSITLTWKKVSGASGYCVYEYNGKTKKYTLIGKSEKLYLTIKKLGSAEKHSYAVRAFKTVGSKKYYSDYSHIKKTATKPFAPTLKVSSGVGYAVISWNNVGNCEYEIYRAEKKNGKYICVGTTKKQKFVSSSLAHGKTYYFKVKACVKNSTATLCSVSSDIKAVTVK